MNTSTRRALIYLGLLLLSCISLSGAKANRLKEVVVLNSYHNGFKWTSDINSAIINEFDYDESTRLFYEFMDSKRFNSDDYFENLRQVYLDKYSLHKIDGVICSDNRAFDFFLKHGKSIWGDIPAVFCGVNDIKDQLHLVDTTKHYIVYEEIDVKSTIELIVQLQPDLEEIIVISDETLSGNIFLNQFIDGFNSLNDSTIKYRIINNTIPEKLKASLTNLNPENKAIYLLSLYTNRNGIPNEMIHESHYFFDDVNIPLYSNWDFLMPNIIVGGHILKAGDQGKIAATTMKSLLNDGKPAIHNKPLGTFTLDHVKLQTHNLDPDNLSFEHIIINEEQSLIQEHKRELSIILIILIVFVFIILLLVSDIIKRKEIEIEYIDSEKRLELALNGANEGLWDINLQTKSTYINDQFAQLLGYKNAPELEVNFNNWQTKIYSQDLNQFKEAFDQHKMGFAETFQCEVRLLNKDQTLSWFSIHGKITEFDGDIPVRVTGIILNINNQKAFEKELQNAKTKAEESDRLKSSFLANMSHEIRTPMNAILGFTDLLIFSDLSPSEKHEYLNLVKKSGENLLALINDIIDISKIESGELKISENAVEINQLFKDLFEVGLSLCKSQEKNIDLSIKSPLEDKNVNILSDPLRIYQITLNLISNAIKFTDKGHVHVSYNIINENELYLSVKDTGLGISNENKELIFDRFRQVDESTIKEHGGTGLGLSITKSLVKLMNGNIDVNSELKKGSEFIVSIPIKVIS